jgi:GT2 family glycosyltransferase
VKLLVVVPIHDRTEFIGEALDSIAQQTRLPDEVVVTGNVRDIPQHPLSEKMAVLGTVTEDPYS